MTSSSIFGRPRTVPLRRPAATPPVPASPLLVVGVPFSGATALAWALGQHPALQPLVGPDAERVAATLRIFEEELVPILEPDELVSFFGGARRRGRARVICAPSIAARIGAARTLFPELGVVHVHRGADGAVPPMVEALRRDGATITEEAVAAIWRRMAGECAAAEELAGPGRAVRLTFEELVTEPMESLSRCLELVGERPHRNCQWPLRLLTTAAPVELRSATDPSLSSTPALHTSGRPSVRGGDRRLRQLVEAVVPADANVLVVSRGDDELLRFRSRHGAHFPQIEDGSWAGFYPEDGATAVAHLRTLVGAGATHLLFPRPALWWLDHYSDLRDHLERAARLVACDTQIGVIWELDSGLRLELPQVLRTPPRVPREPDNRRAFASSVRESRATRRPQTLSGSLWAVTTLYNPAGYATKSENYLRFREGLADAGVPLLAVELAFGDTPFELGPDDAEKLVQLRGADVLWQKERLLNIGIELVPPDCDKVAWLDADVLFAREDWAAETARLLEDHVVVQPFSHCVRLSPGATACEPATLPFGPGEGELFYGVARGIHAHGRRSLDRYADHGHTGFAWAARRSLLDRHSLYDANLLGNGDTDIAHAMFGSTSYWGLRKLGERARAHLRRWAEPLAADVDRSVAYVDGVLTHLWHGDQQHRLYDRPLDVLLGFDPERDLEIGPDGLYRWGAASPELKAWSLDYFAQRREDG